MRQDVRRLGLYRVFGFFRRWKPGIHGIQDDKQCAKLETWHRLCYALQLSIDVQI